MIGFGFGFESLAMQTEALPLVNKFQLKEDLDSVLVSSFASQIFSFIAALSLSLSLSLLVDYGLIYWTRLGFFVFVLTVMFLDGFICIFDRVTGFQL